MAENALAVGPDATAFRGLSSLTRLILRDNHLSVLKDSTFISLFAPFESPISL